MTARSGVAWLVCGLAIAGCVAKDPRGDGSDDGSGTTTLGSATGSVDGDSMLGASSVLPADTAPADDSVDDTGPVTNATWHEHIAPLVFGHCVGCHSGGGIAPYPLESYEEAGPLAPVMALQAEARLMPPWHAIETDECQPPAPFKHDARLTDEQIQLLRDWADLGAPEGDPAQAVPLPPPPSLELPNPTVAVGMPSAVVVEPDGARLDFFHCLSFDPGNAQEVYVDGLQLVPGNHLVVHHALIYVDTDASSASWPGGISPDCGAGAGSGSGPLVGAWVPGSLPMETPEGVGIRLPAGARLILNMHYHALVTGAEVDDATSLVLRWQTAPPEYVAEFQLIGAPAFGEILTSPFSIPANATGHQEVVRSGVSVAGAADVRVFSALNHMHKVGVDMKSSVIRSGGQEECLLQTPAWDFNWQRLYEYDVPIEQAFQLHPGDQVSVRCTYDNSLGNPAVVEMLQEIGLTEPQEVSLGEGTFDEMCIVGLGVAVRQ
jgi:hypothetical protein